MNKLKKWINRNKFTIITLVLMLIMVIIVDNTMYAVYGILGLILAMGLIRAYQFRSNIKQILHNIETIIFGKPLEKEYWKKGELKNLKVKMKWKKKKS